MTPPKTFGIWGNTDKESFWEILPEIITWAENNNLDACLTKRILDHENVSDANSRVISSKNDIEETLTALTEADVNKSIMVDASHGNSQKQFKKQIQVINNLAEQISGGNGSLRGLMLESNLVEGNQSISDNLTYGQSITDACMNWSDTLECLQVVSEAVKKRRG